MEERIYERDEFEVWSPQPVLVPDSDPPLILLSLYGRELANVASHTLGPQRGTLCLQTFVLSGTRKRSDKPSKPTI